MYYMVIKLKAIHLLFILAPILAFYPVTFLGYTIGQYNIVIPQFHQTFKNNPDWPVQDSYASALQDEPWLAYLAQTLRSGQFPLLNIKNGLGSPLLETMQPGVFYILNPLLLFLDVSNPLFFDIFSLIHVYLLLLGLYLLFSFYARKEIAASLAILIGLSGVTYINSNMVHFRGFVWLPFMLFAAIAIARQQVNKKILVLLFVSTLASATAGSIQDFTFSLGTVSFVFLVELFFVKTKFSLRSLAIFVAGLGSSILTSLPAILPFFFSRTANNLNIYNLQAGPIRALQSVDPIYMFTWIIPKIKGLFPYHLFSDLPPQQNQPDFPTVAIFLVVMAVVLMVFNKIQKRLLIFVFIIFASVALLKSMHLDIFDPLGNIPFIKDLKFAKYNLYIATILGIIAASGLDNLLLLTTKLRKKYLRIAYIIFSIIIFSVLRFLAFYPHYINNIAIPTTVKYELLTTHFVSIITLLTSIVVLYFLPKKTTLYLTVIFLTHNILTHPGGYFKRDKNYPIYTNTPKTILSQPKVPTRVLSTHLNTNQNLFIGIESISVWDPILNKYYRNFMATNFNLSIPDLVIQPDFSTPLTTGQIDVLRFLGVNYIEGYPITNPQSKYLNRVRDNLFEVRGNLPRLFLTPTSPPTDINQPDSMATLLNDTPKSPILNITNISANNIYFNVDKTYQGFLVANQSYSTNWHFLGKTPQLSFSLFPSWQVTLHPRQTYVIRYWPDGLTQGIYLAIIGLLLFCLSLIFIPKNTQEKILSLSTS